MSRDPAAPGLPAVGARFRRLSDGLTFTVARVERVISHHVHLHYPPECPCRGETRYETVESLDREYRPFVEGGRLTAADRLDAIRAKLSPALAREDRTTVGWCLAELGALARELRSVEPGDDDAIAMGVITGDQACS